MERSMSMIPSALKPLKAGAAAPAAAATPAEKRSSGASPSASPKKIKLEKNKPDPMEVEKKATAESKSDEESVTSVGVVLFLILNSLYVFVTHGDRSLKEGKFWADWEEQWWGKAPYNTYPLQTTEGEHIPLYVPAEAHDSGQPHQYSREDCLRAILTHALTKKWFPKTVFTEAEWKEAQDKPPVEVVNGLSEEKLSAFERMLIHFSDLQKKGRHLLQELGMETCKAGESAASAAKRCASEELGQNPTLENVGTYEYASRKGTSMSAAFAAAIPFDTRFDQIMADRQKICNWFGPHAWFKYLPGIIISEMEKLKENRETRNGRWMHCRDAIQVLDPKNRQLLRFVMKEVAGEEL